MFLLVPAQALLVLLHLTYLNVVSLVERRKHEGKELGEGRKMKMQKEREKRVRATAVKRTKSQDRK